MEVEPGSSCEECGFDWSAGPATTTKTLRSFRSRYEAQLAAGTDTDGVARLRARPEPRVWSRLEYAAHTRDTIAWYAERIERVLGEQRPRLSAFDWDAACRERHYAFEEPRAVVRALGRVAEDLADRLDQLEDDTWSRVGVGSDGGERSVLALARRAVHEGIHHLNDIRMQATSRLRTT